jgi:hypothetical protein
MLLTQYGVNAYSHISINQIGDDLNEFIETKGKKVHINIRYPATTGFRKKTEKEKQIIQLETIHAAVVRIADEKGLIETATLENVRQKILDNNFSFEFDISKKVTNPKRIDLSAKIIIKPLTDKFEYYLILMENNTLKCRILLYSGVTEYYVFPLLFHQMKWKNENELIINGKEPHVETHIFADTCKAEFINLTKYEKSPYFEMMRRDTSKEEQEQGYQNWLDSLSPESAAELREDAIKTEEYKKSRGIL